MELQISSEDHAKVLRGQDWQAIVTDQQTGRRFLVRGACCGLPECFCDAVIVRETEPARH
ncbi:MAG: hypothetical protein HY661_02480 [Betaproteobacteria bacterium]|nr:hypothetical protein [Betaproteobacteria bacterium]